MSPPPSFPRWAVAERGVCRSPDSAGLARGDRRQDRGGLFLEREAGRGGGPGEDGGPDVGGDGALRACGRGRGMGNGMGCGDSTV